MPRSFRAPSSASGPPLRTCRPGRQERSEQEAHSAQKIPCCRPLLPALGQHPAAGASPPRYLKIASGAEAVSARTARDLTRSSQRSSNLIREPCRLGWSNLKQVRPLRAYWSSASRVGSVHTRRRASVTRLWKGGASRVPPRGMRGVWLAPRIYDANGLAAGWNDGHPPLWR